MCAIVYISRLNAMNRKNAHSPNPQCHMTYTQCCKQHIPTSPHTLTNTHPPHQRPLHHHIRLLYSAACSCSLHLTATLLCYHPPIIRPNRTTYIDCNPDNIRKKRFASRVCGCTRRSRHSGQNLANLDAAYHIRKKNLRLDAQAASGHTRRSGRSGRTLAGHMLLPT